jgi:hypothetical protein
LITRLPFNPGHYGLTYLASIKLAVLYSSAVFSAKIHKLTSDISSLEVTLVPQANNIIKATVKNIGASDITGKFKAKLTTTLG